MVVALLWGIGKVSGRLQEVQRMLLLQWSYYIKLCTGPRHNLAQLLLPSAQFFFLEISNSKRKFKSKLKVRVIVFHDYNPVLEFLQKDGGRIFHF